MTSLELRQVNKNYGAYHALRGIDLSVEPRRVHRDGRSVLDGGKSTLLKSIAGLETISSGQIMINGRDVSQTETLASAASPWSFSPTRSIRT